MQRSRTERKHRRVGIRPAPDTMAVLTGYLPVEQGIACYAALRQHADTAVATGDSRTRDQIMADTVVERITGQTTAADVNIELHLMMPLDSLINPDHPKAAMIPGYGPLPAELARDILASSQGRKWWRRLFTAPCNISTGSGPIVGGDPTRRYFDGWLAKLIRLRDQTCRDPYCDAPIRHLDHITRHSDGGPTSFANGRGAVRQRQPRPRNARTGTSDVIDCGFHGTTAQVFTSPHPPATTTSAAPPTHHEGIRRQAEEGCRWPLHRGS